jgi:hypothetical protein
MATQLSCTCNCKTTDSGLSIASSIISVLTLASVLLVSFRLWIGNLRDNPYTVAEFRDLYAEIHQRFDRLQTLSSTFPNNNDSYIHGVIDDAYRSPTPLRLSLERIQRRVSGGGGGGGGGGSFWSRVLSSEVTNRRKDVWEKDVSCAEG